MSDPSFNNKKNTGFPENLMNRDNRDSLNLAMLAHFLGMLCLLAPPFNIICPLVIWLFKRHDDPYIEFHAREALNFQITLAIAGFVFSILAFLFIGFILMGFLALFALIFGIRASLKASRNEFYQYPFTLRFVK